MKPIWITTILSAVILSKAFACLNVETRDLSNGIFLYHDREGNVPYGHIFHLGDFESVIPELDSLYKATKDLDYLSDKGLLLILLERYEEAIELYLEIEKIEPNRYSTASNIGTAYELFGQNENALKWIKKSVELDSNSHHKSEWIHVNILKAKIKGEEFYTTNFLLNTDFGSDTLPISDLTKQQLKDLSMALFFQLNERVSFVKPKEKIVSQLLFDLGNIAFLLGNYMEAIADYEQANLYGFEGPLIEQRIEKAKFFSHKRRMETKETESMNPEKSFPFINYGLWFLGGLFLIFFAVWRFRRMKKENS